MPRAPTPPRHDVTCDGYQVVEALPNPVALIESDGSIVCVNQAWRQFSRNNGGALATEECAGQNYFDVCGRAGADEVLAGLLAVLEGRQGSFEFEYPCHSAEQARWFMLQAVSLGAATGRLLLMHVDISSRKLAELSQQAKCALLQQTLDTVETLIVSLDRDGRVNSINRCGARVLGRPAAEIVGCSWFASCLPQPEGMTRVFPAFRQIMEGRLEAVEYFENEILTQDGARRLIAWHNAYLKDADGQIIGTLSAGNDVTLKQALEAALRRKADLADRLKSIAATVPGAIFAFCMHPDGACSFPYIDGRELEALGFSAEDFVVDASPLVRMIHPDDIVAVGDDIRASARALQPWHGQFRIHHPHLGLRWIEGNAIPQAGADGSVLWHGYLSDATERIEAIRRLEQSHAQIQALVAHMEVVREEERTRIARELHDELGQTLTAIRMNLRQLGRLAGAGHTGMHERIDAVEAIVEDAMLSVRRISQELHPRILDTLGLGGAIEWEAGEFRKRMGIRCRCAVPADDIPLSESAKTHIYRLFQEAMTNISRHARATAVEVALDWDGTALTLQVSDNGVGIRGEALVGNTLGLTGMKERAAQIGGGLTISTAPVVKGTCVALRVPLAAGSGRTRA